MLTVAPLTIVLMGLIGLALVCASVLRMLVVEHQLRGTSFLADQGPQERPRVAA